MDNLKTTNLEWLREFADDHERDLDGPVARNEAKALREAADEIQRLRTQVGFWRGMAIAPRRPNAEVRVYEGS